MARSILCFLAFFSTLGIGSFFGLINMWTKESVTKPNSLMLEATGTHETDPFASAPPARRASAPRSGPRSLTCYDLSILPIWGYLRKDPRIEAMNITEETSDCSMMVEVSYRDLNHDRNPEILVRGKNIWLCGAVGHSAFWIFDKYRDGYRNLLEGSDYIDVADLDAQILKQRTNGYRDILLRYHFSASETGYSYFKFNGTRYREDKCLYEVPKYDSQNRVRWTLVTCKQFFRDQGLSEQE